MKTVRYNLSNKELKQLKDICKHTGLHYSAMASRPKVARELLQDVRFNQDNHV